MKNQPFSETLQIIKTQPSIHPSGQTVKTLLLTFYQQQIPVFCRISRSGLCKSINTINSTDLTHSNHAFSNNSLPQNMQLSYCISSSLGAPQFLHFMVLCLAFCSPCEYFAVPVEAFANISPSPPKGFIF